MRIAVSGSHGSGKSTLVDDLLARCPGYDHVQEPYWEMVERGVVFADPPTVEDMVEQLARSIDLILRSLPRPDVLFDRSPLDFVAYAEVLAGRAGDDWAPPGRLLAGIEAALATLELIVFLPLSEPDEIGGTIERPRLRRAVDARLKAILRDDDLGLLADRPRVLEVSGTPAERVAQALRAMEQG